MSTDVTIVGFDQNVPQWATEKTLDDIRAVFHKSYGLDKERTDTLDSVFEEIQKTRTITDRYLSSINKALKGGPVDTRTDKIRKAEIGAIEDTVSRLGGLSMGAGIARGGMIDLSKHTGMLGNAMNILSSKFTWGALIVAPALAAFKDTVKTIIQTTDAFAEFHKVGIIYNEGILSHREALAKLGMGTKDMTEIVQKHARTISLVGIPKFMEMGQRLEENNEQLYQMGLTTKDAVGFMSQHLEMQRLMGIFEFQDAQSLSKAVMQTMKSLTAYTKIMNKSREDIIESQKTMLDSADFARLIASMEPELARGVQSSFSNVTGALAALPNEEGKKIADLITDMVASPIPEISKAYKDLMQTGQHEMANVLLEQATSIRSGATTAEGAWAFVNKIFESAEQTSQSGWQQMMSMVEGFEGNATFIGGQLTKAGREFETRMKTFEEELGMSRFDPQFMQKLGTLISDEQKAVTQTKNEINKMTEGWDYLKVQKVFEVLGGEDGIAGGIELLNVGLQRVNKTIWKMAGTNISDDWLKYGAALVALATAAGIAQGALLRFAFGAAAARGGASAGFLGKATKAAKGVGFGAGGYLLGEAGSMLLGRETRGGGISSALGSVAGGAGTGAMIGSVIPGIGTAIGAALGGVIGGGLGLYQNRDAIFGGGKISQEGEQTRRLQKPETISQAEIDAAINSIEGGDLAPILKSIAVASNAQLDKVNELVRLVRSGQTGITGQQFS